MKKNLKGFTLVEVLIVIIIVGILIAALLPRLTGAQAASRDASRKVMTSQLAQGIGLLMNEGGSVTPAGTGVCVNAVTAITGTVNGTATDLGAYLSIIPRDPQSTHANTSFNTVCPGFAVAHIATDGASILVQTDVEQNTSAGNSDAPTAYTLAAFQTAVDGGGEYYGVIVR